MIWDNLYTAYVPDVVTQNTDFLKIFGVRTSGDKKIDEMLSTNTTQVMIPIITIVEYYDQGIPVLIPKREDMLAMNRDITLYLAEWEYNMKYDINISEVPRELMISLDKFCKYIYNKATAKEIVGDKINSMRFGLRPRLEVEPTQETSMIKPDYEGISKLIRQRTRR